MSYLPPAPLQDSHRLEEFRCTEASLEAWLKRTARKNHLSGASRVFVVADSTGAVVGYYALAAGAVTRALVSGSLRRNMPEPIPVAVLGRLAVHSAHTGRGLGHGLLKDAILRTQRLAQDLGMRALLCHAVDERAQAFYLHHGFIVSPVEPLTVMLPLA
jgi:GNAT superfamily N-acetyltransferase